MLNRFLAGAAALAVIAGSTVVLAQSPGPQNMGQPPAAGMPPGQDSDGPDDDFDVQDSQQNPDQGGYDLQSGQAPQPVQYDPAQGAAPAYGPPPSGAPNYGYPQTGYQQPHMGPPQSQYGYQQPHMGPHYGQPQYGYQQPQNQQPQYGYQGPPTGPQYGYQQQPTSPPYGADQASAPPNGDYSLASAPTAEELNAFIEGRIASLRTALKLTPAQQQSWTAFETAARELAKLQAERATQASQQLASAAAPSTGTSAPTSAPSGAARTPPATGAAPSASAAPPASQAPNLAEMIDDLRRTAEAMMRDGAAFKKLAEATAPLYKSLDDTQKRSFAELAEPLLPLGGEN